MPSEVRHIFFSEHEVKGALINYCAMKEIRIKMDKIESLIIGNNDQVTATLMVEKALYEVPESMNFGSSDLAAALLIYCRSHKIPLPRKSVKKLNAKENQLYMTIIYNDKIDFKAEGLKGLPKVARRMMVM